MLESCLSTSSAARPATTPSRFVVRWPSRACLPRAHPAMTTPCAYSRCSPALVQPAQARHRPHPQCPVRVAVAVRPAAATTESCSRRGRVVRLPPLSRAVAATECSSGRNRSSPVNSDIAWQFGSRGVGFETVIAAIVALCAATAASIAAAAVRVPVAVPAVVPSGRGARVYRSR